MQASEPKDLNPYVAVVAKKHRNLKKKLERIAKAEQLLEQGKVLDEEQRVLLSSKKAIEKSVAELANIKQLLEEVAKSEESTKKASTDVSASATTEVQVSEEPVQDAATHTESTEQFVAATMTEEDDYEAPDSEENLKEKFNEFIERLIKALHVYERYTNVTSQPLPDTVMYFGRTLLGLTSISSFQDTLTNSIRVAGFYLHDDLANSNDVIRGTSYAKLASEIDVLVEEMERVQQRGSTNALTALLRTTIAPVSPTNTPATESVPTYDSMYGGLQFNEQPLGNFNQFQFSTSAAPYQTTETVYQAPVAETRPAVPIAPTLPEFDSEPVVEEPEEEVDDVEEVGQEDAHFEEEDVAQVEEIVEEPAVVEEVAVEEVAPANDNAVDSRFTKNVRVRGDPSRAARKAEDAKKHASRGASHHHDTTVASQHQEPAQKSFRDRLVSGGSTNNNAATVATPSAAPATTAAPIAVAPALQDISDDAEKRKRAPRAKKEEVPAESESVPAASSTDKPKRDRNVRTRTRRPDGADQSADGTDAGKKWSSIAATSSGEAAANAAGEERKAHKSSPPKGDRPPRTSGDKPFVPRPRREKKDDVPAASEAPVSADGFQAVSRRSAPAKGSLDGEKKPAPRGDRPTAAKKPAAHAVSK